MRFRLMACLSVLALCRAAVAAPDAPFVGKLDKGLVADRERFELVILTPAAKAPVPLAEGERAFLGGNPPWPGADPAMVVLLESADGKPLALFYDRNRDGKVAADERTPLSAGELDSKERGVEIRLPLSSGPFPDYPLVFRRFQGKVSGGMGLPADGLLLTQTRTAFVQGKVDVQGRQVPVRYAFTPGEELNPGTIEQGVDGDGDGHFGGAETPETDGGRVGQSEPPIFPVGALYLSTAKLDVAAGRIEMVSHPASDYKRVSLTAGSQMPDFSFSDYAGKTHKLSELKGQHVLLEFWSTWCAPCIAEFPRLKELYAAHHGQGFEIVSIAWNEPAESSGRRVQKEQLPWLQATSESTAELATRDLRLSSIPFAILLDPQGKILATTVAERAALTGEGLKATIDKLFPAPKAQPGR